MSGPTHTHVRPAMRTAVNALAVSLGLAVVLALTVAGARLAAAPAAAADGDAPTHYGRMILVLDSSGSMAEPASGGSTRIAAAKRALTEVVRRLPGESNVGLRVYGATVFDKE